jgi:hypothetical protein
VSPSPLILLVLALAAFRTWRLLALDTLPPLVRLRSWLVQADWFQDKQVFGRPLLEEWLSCAWCFGLWASAGWYICWLEWPRATIYAAAPLALSAAVGICASLLSD